MIMDEEYIDNLFGNDRTAIFCKSERRAILDTLNGVPLSVSGQVMLYRARRKIRTMLSIDQSVWMSILHPKPKRDGDNG